MQVLHLGWEGRAATGPRLVVPFAQAYLKRWKRPSVLPITRFNDGMESEAFKAHFGPPEKLGCCTVS